jgi:serine protease DegQ
MKNKIVIGISVLLVGFLLGGLSFYLLGEFTGRQRGYAPLGAPNAPKQIIDTSRAFSEIAGSLSPCVVNISTTKVVRRDAAPLFDDPFFDLFNPFRDFRSPKKWKEQSLGSGVIVSSEGYIVTNNHVIEQADEIKITLFDKRSFKARLVGADPKTDVAVVKVDAKNLPSIRWGDSDKLQVGEFVLAIGNPFGLSHTVTMGIISAVGRANVGIADYEDFIQTDAAINPGNSGGALVDVNGNLIGINSAIYSPNGGSLGIGFAIPATTAKKIMEQIILTGSVTRGWIGVAVQEITPELAESFKLGKIQGVLISEVVRGGPADQAKVRAGDILTSVDGKALLDSNAMLETVAALLPGKTVTLKLLRNQREVTVQVKIGRRPRPKPQQ